jgi:cytochrome bd-type quinol oxidase subunit 2
VDERVYNHYLYVVICVLLIVFCYIFIGLRLVLMKQRNENLGNQKKFYSAYAKLASVPLVLLICFGPITWSRLTILIAKERWTLPVLNVMILMLSCNGLLNALLLIWKRRLIQKWRSLLTGSEIHQKEKLSAKSTATEQKKVATSVVSAA